MKSRIRKRTLFLSALLLMSFLCSFMTIAVEAEEHIHYYKETRIEPQCGVDGFYSIYCNCGAGTEKILPADPHTFGEWIVTEQPTLNKNGVQEKTCTTCGYVQQATYICPHEFPDWELTTRPTPTKNGEETRICTKCEKLETRIFICPHDYSDWILTTNPTPTKNGIETKTCSICTKEETREYICTHEETTKNVIKKATCQNKGYVKENCSLCTLLIKEYETDITDCNYSDWIIDKYATPVSNGSKHKTCETCGDTKYQDIIFNRKSGNSIYIASAGINANYVYGDFTQAAVDNNDIVYNTDRLDSNNPIILGHNYGSLGKLYKTTIGSYIYIIHSSGEVETYKVFVSEKAREVDDGTDIKGYSTGERLITYYDTKTIHLYTCYGSERWLVVARKV